MLHQPSHSSNRKNYLVSLGGSLIVPGAIDLFFLKKFRKLILGEVRKGSKFLILSGGGHTSRIYQQAANKAAGASDEVLDWIGIETCKLNAMLLNAVFFPLISALSRERGGFRLRNAVSIMSGGRKPGNSSDSTSVYYAQKAAFKTIINLTNVAGVYDRDPNLFPKAKLIPHMTWKQFLQQFGSSRRPGQHKPFDPSAARPAWRLGIKVVIVDGRNIKNLQNFFQGKDFRGTVIE